MALKKYMRRRRKKGEGKTLPFFQSECLVNDSAEGGSFFVPGDEKVHAKLKVSESGDRQEQEADRMADHVAHARSKDDSMQRAPVKQDEAQRRVAPEEEKMNKKGKEEEKVSKKDKEEERVSKKTREDETVDKKAASAKDDDTHDRDQLEDHTIATRKTSPAPVAPAPSSASIPKDGGAPLPAGVASEMSASFGFDFGNVKIHADKDAQHLSEQLNAQAFTYKGDIYFNEGKFDPSTEHGRWLLAHELTHVVQQRPESLTPADQQPADHSADAAQRTNA